MAKKMPKGLMNLKEIMMEKSPMDKKSDKKMTAKKPVAKAKGKKKC